ncbi:MAG: hypothetical protein J3R72DRAFT_424630 [Linnemannia gamsii]|nr:MAG: hypothetical protein J3R72DRAFT_424630 [Linnemannia gamsii]
MEPDLGKTKDSIQLRQGCEILDSADVVSILGDNFATEAFESIVDIEIDDPWDMSDISAVYEELLKSNKGDILVKLKDGKQLKVISYLIKNRSSIFNTMLESPMREASTGVS